MHKIEFGKIDKDFPEDISEMTPAQFQYFSYLEMLRQSGQISMEALEVHFVYFALNMVRTSDSAKIVENVTKLRELVRPYFIEKSHNGKTSKIVDLNFVINPFPSIVCNKETLLGPADALQDCSYEEVFVHAHREFMEFSNTRDMEALTRLAAVLYRPAKNGKRTKFKAKDLEDHQKLTIQLKPEVKFGIFLYFASCHKFITTNDALDIGGGITVDIASLFKPDSTQGNAKGIGPVGIIYSIAESGVFGSAKETGAQNVYDILIRMVQLNEQAKKIKADAKRNKS